MYNRNLLAGSLAVITAIGLMVVWPLRAQEITADILTTNTLNVKSNAVILRGARIDGNLTVGFRSPSIAKVHILQGGTGVGLFLGDGAPLGQALFETDLMAPKTHAWFMENGERVFSVVGGGTGYFKGNLDVGGDATFAGTTLFNGVISVKGAAQLNNGLTIGDGRPGFVANSGLVATPDGSRLPAATLNVVGNATIHQDTQIAGTLFVGVGPPNPAGSAPRPDTSNTKLRIWGNVVIAGNQSISGDQRVNGNQTLTGTQTLTGDQRLSANLSFGVQPRQMINLFDKTYGIGVQDSGFYFRTDFDYFWYRGGGDSGRNGDPGTNQAGSPGVRLMQLDRNGQLLIAGSVVTPVLQITGGSDVSEPFKMSRPDIPKGSVVIIDEENAGHLKLSEVAYDRRVAGIVSGANGINPGISLSQQGVIEGGQNVALSGRVYVLADTSSGPIKPGDLLTTSDTPGFAMKVSDNVRAQGAVIGKAMSAMIEGQGMVLVLVTLQ